MNIQLTDNNPPSKWYSRHWTRIMYSIDGGEWQECNGFVWGITEGTTIRAKTEQYRPTIKQRLKLLFK